MARSFNGSTQRLSCSPQVSGYPFSFSLWFRTPDISAQGTLVSFSDESASSNYYRLLFRGDQSGDPIAIQGNIAGGPYITNSSNGVSGANVWHHAIGVFSDATSRHLWLNGTKTVGATTSSAFSAGVDTFAIAHMVRSGDGTYFNGDIAEVGVWGRSLTDDEALILAAGMSPLAVSDGLVAYYPLFGRAGASGGEEDWVGGLALSAANSPIVTDHPRIIYPRRRSMIVVPAAASGPPTLTALTASMLTSTGGRLTVT